jgi:hypothetical protein
MNRKSLIWYVTTVVLSMVLNSTVVFASDDSTETFESIENVPLSTYETSNVENETFENTYIETSLISTEGEEYTTTLELSTEESTESFEVSSSISELEEFTTSETTTTMEESLSVDTTSSTTLEDTNYTTNEIQTSSVDTAQDTTISFEKSSYVEDSFYIVNPLESASETESSIVALESSATSYDISQTSSLVHTLSNTTIKNDESSPKTDHVAVIVPVLLVMAGALFIGATSTPKRQ